MRRLLTLAALCGLLLSLTLLPARAQDDLDALLAGMTLEQKVAQTFMVSVYGTAPTFAALDLLATWQPGGLVLVGRNAENAEQVARLTNGLQQAVVDAGGPPMLIAADQEGGRIQRIREGVTIWPAPALLTATRDADLAYRVGRAMGADLRAVGVTMNLAPVADLDTNPDNPIINRRSPGSDPALVAAILPPLIAGLRDAGVVATVKHFPGHGDTSEDSHTGLPDVPHDLARLDALELRPFAAAIEGDVGAVMTGHLWMSAFDAEPLPASLSPNIVDGLLREHLGYTGLVITDALDMDAIDTVYGPGEAAIRALLAGSDMVLIGANVGESTQAAAMQAVVDAVRAGRISEARINEAARRVLAVKQAHALLAWSPVDVPPPTSAGDHAELVAELFATGVTLAVDREGLLPLAANQPVTLIYPGGRARVQAQCSLYSSMATFYAVSDSPTADEIETAGRIGAGSDPVVVFTRNADFNPAQQALVAALPPERVIVVALASPYDFRRFPAVSTYLTTYGDFDAAIDTACAVLFGVQEARGTLPISLPLVP